MVVGIPMMWFYDSGVYFYFYQSQNPALGRGGEGVMLLPGVRGGEGKIRDNSRSQF